jgi:hypothetical protein
VDLERTFFRAAKIILDDRHLLPARLRRWATIGFLGIVDLAPKTDQLSAFVDACYLKPYVARDGINSKDSMLLA